MSTEPFEGNRKRVVTTLWIVTILIAIALVCAVLMVKLLGNRAGAFVEGNYQASRWERLARRPTYDEVLPRIKLASIAVMLFRERNGRTPTTTEELLTDDLLGLEATDWENLGGLGYRLTVCDTPDCVLLVGTSETDRRVFVMKVPDTIDDATRGCFFDRQ